MATVAAFQEGQSGNGQAAKLPLSASRGAIGAILFLLVAFFLLAAGAATGAPPAGGAPVEAGAFILDPSTGSAKG
jgi:hypothetical protein